MKKNLTLILIGLSTTINSTQAMNPTQVLPIQQVSNQNSIPEDVHVLPMLASVSIDKNGTVTHVVDLKLLNKAQLDRLISIYNYNKSDVAAEGHEKNITPLSYASGLSSIASGLYGTGKGIFILTITAGKDLALQVVPITSAIFRHTKDLFSGVAKAIFGRVLPQKEARPIPQQGGGAL